jgi:hypothetical protein
MAGPLLKEAYAHGATIIAEPDSLVHRPTGAVCLYALRSTVSRGSIRIGTKRSGPSRSAPRRVHVAVPRIVYDQFRSSRTRV